MTIKYQWMLVLVLSVILSVAVNSIVLSSLINHYFVEYSTDNYNKNVSQLIEFSEKLLIGTEYTQQQIVMQLETYLSDPINEIKLYDVNGKLIANAVSDSYPMMGMMGNTMMNKMMGNASEEIDSIDIKLNENTIGKLNITRYSSIGNSFGTRKFIASLTVSSLFSFAIVFVLIFFVGFYVSQKMSKDLRLTAQQAIDIDLGNHNSNPKSKVQEIRTIQQSLETLQSSLKLKQTSRKKLIDELVHQIRTPLTILKSHLEGFQDGIIHFSSDEIKTCESQIDNITSILTNMSGMIDAQKNMDAIDIEEVDLSQLLKQIVGGIKVQFNKKGVELQLLSHQNVLLQTDRYKLSQVIYNILTNAYKYTEAHGKVTIEYKHLADNIVITIQDTGCGINENELSQIFDAYFRGQNSTNTVGEGIGLYIVRENLMKINGKIEVKSERGVGSKFVISVPLT